MILLEIWCRGLAQMNLKCSIFLFSLELQNLLAGWFKILCLLLSYAEEFFEICVVATWKDFSDNSDIICLQSLIIGDIINLEGNFSV